MKSWLIPVVILVLIIAGSTAAVLALDGAGGGDNGPASESLPPVNSDGASTQPACVPGASECDDTLDTCGGIGTLVACDDPVLEPLDGDSGPIRSDEGIDPNECNLVHNINACDQDDLDRLGGDSLLPVNPDADKDASCEPVPLRSDCGIDPNECNQVHNITACDEPAVSEPGDPAVQDAGTYRVVVSYNTSVTQPDLDETAEFLRGFDAGLEFLVQESWPPTGVASVQTDTPNFCDAIFDTLASQSYIDDFSCNPQQIFDGSDGDTPVVNVNDLP